MTMNDYIDGIAGTALFALPVAFLAAFACFGAGRLLCEKGFRLKEVSPLAAFVCGFNLLSLLLIPVPFRFGGLLLLAGLVPAVRFAGELRPCTKWMIPPLILLAFSAGNLLCAPSGWDECVYQLTVPARWAADGTAEVYADLPYSGFPMMPQYGYAALVFLAGASAAKAFAWIVLACVILSPFAFRRFRNGTGAALSCALFCSPVVLHMLCNSYAEPVLALELAAGVLLLRSGAAAGFCAGGAAAVKLTGVFPALALFVLTRKKLVLAAAGGMMGILFYARPFLRTGNPFYPYFGGWFGGGTAGVEAMSEFHHAIGSAPFGTSQTWVSFFTAPVLTAFPENYRLFDGCWGRQSLIVLGFAGFYLIRKVLSHKYRLAAAVGILYGAWYFTSPQTRFLLPCAVLVLYACGFAVSLLEGRIRKLVCLGLAGVSLWEMFSTNEPANTLQRWRYRNDRVDQLYSETGGTLLPAADAIRSLPGKTLLLFEERTLYMPCGKAEIATPYFQAEYFTPPNGLGPEEILRIMRRANVRNLYFRVPENNPDLSAEYLEGMKPFLDSLLILERTGRLKRFPVTESSLIYSVPESGK